MFYIFSKFYERVIKSQIVAYIDIKLSKFLSAYRRSYGTQHVLMRLIEEWKQKLDKNFVCGAVLMDALTITGTDQNRAGTERNRAGTDQNRAGIDQNRAGTDQEPTRTEQEPPRNRPRYLQEWPEVTISDIPQKDWLLLPLLLVSNP